MANYKSVKWYEENREKLCNFSKYEIEPVKNCIVPAPVKSGKKEMVLYQARRSDASPVGEKHMLLTNFVAKDCKEQKRELEDNGVQCFYGNELKESKSKKGEKKDGFKKRVEERLKNNELVTIHIDESDYGTGNTQQLLPTFEYIKEIATHPNIKIRLYSATNHESIYSDFSELCEVKEYTPPENFHGPLYYLNRGLVTEAEPYWNKEDNYFSNQGLQCVNMIEESDPPAIGVLRLSAHKNQLKFNEIKKSLSLPYEEQHRFIREHTDRGIKILLVDGENPFDWGYPNGNRQWEHYKNEKLLIILNQTCSRSAEVGFHPWIKFWHDFRLKTSTYTTCSQAMERVNHYKYNYLEGYWDEDSVDTRIFGCLDTFRLSAGVISVNEYIESCGRRLSSRVSSNQKLSTSPEDYEIIYTVGDYPDTHIEKLKEYDISLRTNKFHKDEEGKYVSTVRGNTRVWRKEEVEREIFMGLKAKVRSHRTIVYYDEEDTPIFRTVIHNGNMSVENKSRKTIYND